jgi:hypothetical protein
MLPVSLPEQFRGEAFHVMTGNFSGEYLSQRSFCEGLILNEATLPADDSM